MKHVWRWYQQHDEHQDNEDASGSLSFGIQAEEKKNDSCYRWHPSSNSLCVARLHFSSPFSSMLARVRMAHCMRRSWLIKGMLRMLVSFIGNWHVALCSWSISFLLSTTQDILAIIQQWDDLVHSNTLTPEQRMIHEQRMIQHYVAAIFDQQNLVIILFLSSPTCLWGSIFLSALWLIQASCDIYWAESRIKKSAMVILSAMDTLCME